MHSGSTKCMGIASAHGTIGWGKDSFGVGWLKFALCTHGQGIQKHDWLDCSWWNLELLKITEEMKDYERRADYFFIASRIHLRNGYGKKEIVKEAKVEQWWEKKLQVVYEKNIKRMINFLTDWTESEYEEKRV